MRALQFQGQNKSELVTLSRPVPPEGWAVVRVHFCSLCGSDLWLYRGRWHGSTYPVVPGHEWAGVVADAPEGHSDLIGRRVIGDLISECRTCGPCRDGLPVMCENLVEVGFTVPGACAPYVAVPVENLYPVPDGLGLDAATQAEPLSVALHAVSRIGLRAGERVAVLGCGGIGLLILQAARATGAVVPLVADPVAGRRAVAVQFGADAAVHPVDLPSPGVYADRFDVVFEASGDPASSVRALTLLRPGGRVCQVGYQVGAESPIETAQLPLTYGSMVGVMGPGGMFRKAVDLLARGVVDVAPILTDRVGLDDFELALNRAETYTGSTIRVLFDLRGEPDEEAESSRGPAGR